MNVRLRPARMDDGDRLLSWRNEPAVRAASFDDAIVTVESHWQWLVETLGRADRRLYIAEADGHQIGTARLDLTGDEALVSLTVAPEWRGRGAGVAVLRALADTAFAAGVARLRACVKAGNVASRATFERAGYRLAGDGAVLEFVRDRAAVTAVIQARLGSQRLPGKVLRDLAGRPMLSWLVERLRAARETATVIVATSYERRDDAIAAFAHEQGVACVRGSEADLVSRLRLAADETRSTAIVRVTADCPFVDPAVVDTLVRSWRAPEGRYDVVVNNDPPSYPHGLDAEVLPAATLARLDEEIVDPYYREWVPFWWREHRDRYRVLNVPHHTDLTGHRWTVDYAEDLCFADHVFRALLPAHGELFLMDEVLAFVTAHPDVMALNAARAHR